MTSRGMKEDDMRHIARLIDRVITNHGKEEIYAAVKEDVKHFCRQFELYPTLNYSPEEIGKRIGETIDDAVEGIEQTVKSVVDEVKQTFKRDS
jgi:glycine/serine hydroxymethyltransferase